MKKSFFFSKILFFLFIASMLWTLLTIIFYNLIATPLFSELRANDLEPKARYIAASAKKELTKVDFELDKVLNASYDLFGAWTFVIDYLHQEHYSSPLPESIKGNNDIVLENINDAIKEYQHSPANRIVFRKSLVNKQEEFLFIGIPITMINGNNIQIIGAVFMIQPMAELTASYQSLNSALILASLAGLLIMIIPLFFTTRRLFSPIWQMKNIAVAITKRDFSKRVDDSQPGVIGELASAMNDMAKELSTTIKALVFEKNRLNQILNGIAEGILAVDSTGKVTQINAMVWSLLGLKSVDPVPSAEQILETSSLKELFSEAISEQKKIDANLDINNRCINVQITPLLEHDLLIGGAVGLFRDITESERLEQTRRDYVANVSHELRSPLTSMRALLEPLDEGMVKDDITKKRYYNILLRETLRLSRLINDMLELSRLQSKHITIEQQAFSITDVIYTIQDRYFKQFRNKNIKLILDEDLEYIPEAWGNPDRIEQILIILVDNALKFTPAGGEITLGVNCLPDNIQIFVKDTGEGLNGEDIEHVFDRFYKADKSHNLPGTGLGLSIAKEILGQMGQDIWVNSTYGQGAKFTFTLNYASNMINDENASNLEIRDIEEE